MTGYVLLASFVLILTYMTAWFIVAGVRRQLSLADVAYGGGFIVAAVAALAASHRPTSILLTILVIIWGARLMAHIGARVFKGGEDRRYRELSDKWSKQNFWLRAYGSIFVTQSVLIWVVALPLALGSQADASLVWWQWLAAVIWALAFITEALGDYQLKSFLANKTKSDKIMNKGLWRYSRHPNYFGEIVEWFMIGVIALAAPFGYLGLIGPIVLVVSIIFISGLPPLEKRHMDDPDYIKYRRQTSLLVPLPPRR